MRETRQEKEKKRLPLTLPYLRPQRDPCYRHARREAGARDPVRDRQHRGELRPVDGAVWRGVGGLVCGRICCGFRPKKNNRGFLCF